MLKYFVFIAILLIQISVSAEEKPYEVFPKPSIEWNPQTYLCLRAEEEINIDGIVDEQSWKNAAWTSIFVDIEGPSKPIPNYQTRVKMLWDDNYFYCFAELEEPDVWATLIERDSVIYHDNDFEVFIDPDKDNHLYYELEINALNTVWDLLLVKPYRDGAPAINAWDIQGLKTAVKVIGTINEPTSRDLGWNVEIAIPWKVLSEAAGVSCPPKPSDQWKINFSRVEWKTHVEDGKYVKDKDPSTGNNLPENNWVWSPQGLIAMHYPEMWGLVQFSGNTKASDNEKVEIRDDDKARWALMQVYYAEREWQMNTSGFCSDFEKLKLRIKVPDGWTWPPEIVVSGTRFEVSMTDKRGTRISVTEDGKIHFIPAEVNQ